jgi:transcriptional regulator with XRE-family HTH domain
MSGTPEQRSELAAFLRARRARLDRATTGLPAGRGGRASGASREEVAVLSGMSVTWYTWLEQARDINPSRQVLDALARVLGLSPAEHAYVLGLTGFAAAAPSDAEPIETVPAHLQRLLDGMPDFPAYAVAPDWTIVGWNAAYERLFPRIASVPPEERNLLRLVFTDPTIRTLLGDWAADSRHFVAEFRAEAGARLGEPAYLRLVRGLQEESREFAVVWADHEVARFASRERRFHHPDLGETRYEHHRLIPSDSPGVHVVIYSPAPL